MVKALTLFSAILLSLSEVALATSNPCIVLDWDFNLYAFGLNGKDYNATGKNAWTSSEFNPDMLSVTSDDIIDSHSGQGHYQQWTPVSIFRSH